LPFENFKFILKHLPVKVSKPHPGLTCPGDWKGYRAKTSWWDCIYY